MKKAISLEKIVIVSIFQTIFMTIVPTDCYTDCYSNSYTLYFIWFAIAVQSNYSVTCFKQENPQSLEEPH